ncbi:hypothetical protein [Cellulomonas biazotea]|jgi:hypothetical protein|uniref:Uncharacterized protein n=1 Tax=Cellulomonas biazotea TaxID=1709 RepID=A0A402DU48_9CELL|nr:hypothetical protein [Cellulomonas biazotea]GCE77637.1 hypothetical protein CBZ_26930 [Cellulomonas biazotea]
MAFDRFDRFNEKVTLFFLKFVGPPSTAAPDHRGRVVTEDEVARETHARQAFERVVGPDGKAYLVERDGPTG